MTELGTFGAILRFAIKVEQEAAAYYEQLVQESLDTAAQETVSALAQAHRKRQQTVERMRREQVTEMILEPIYGLQEEDWLLDLQRGKQQEAARAENLIAAFYTAAADKVSIPEVARGFRRLAREGAQLETTAKSLL